MSKIKKCLNLIALTLAGICLLSGCQSQNASPTNYDNITEGNDTEAILDSSETVQEETDNKENHSGEAETKKTVAQKEPIEKAVLSEAANEIVKEREFLKGDVQDGFNQSENGVSSMAFCDVNADDVAELLIVYIGEKKDDIQPDMFQKSVYADLYEYIDGKYQLKVTQMIGTIDYCDSIQVRLMFNRQQAAFYILTNKELVWAFTGAEEFVCSFYKLSLEAIEEKWHWSQNNIETLIETEEIIQEMKSVGIAYMDMNYLNFTSDMTDYKEMLLLQNHVEAEGEDARTRTYRVKYATREELQKINETDWFELSTAQKELISERNSGKFYSAEDLKRMCEKEIEMVQYLLSGYNGVEVDETLVEGPNIDIYDDYWVSAKHYTSLQEVEDYLKSKVSDEVFQQYFNKDEVMEKDGKVCFPQYSGYWIIKMDIDSLEIEGIDGNIYTVSVKEDILPDGDVEVVFIKLQEADGRWIIQSIE